MDTDTRLYKGYKLTAIPYAGGWQVHVYPTHTNMLKPVPDYVSEVDKEAAFKTVESLVDRLISK